jgi:hexosaminidase
MEQCRGGQLVRRLESAPIHMTPILLPMPRRIDLMPAAAAGAGQQVIETIDPATTRPQGYRIEVDPLQVRLVAHDAAAMFWGQQTLAQLHRQLGPALPPLRIEDWPDFPVRGVMLDISRDKVPTMVTLYALVDLLASWKINQLQLYMEHTFAYRGHEDVWRAASPMTAEEIRALDAYCRQRFIELVPNQNSFGHMQRWLNHPRYLSLAEAPLGAQTPWGYRWDGPFSLCPTDPRSLELLADLYAQLLPNFSSRLFNVGCDETFDIGQGRSKAQCESRGIGEVYLEFLLRVRDLAASHGRRIMFWGDVILKHPDLVPRLPRDAVALCWGYEADHPFEEETSHFQQSGIPFFVCPGTSSWCSIAGRTDNMLANQRRAAEAGLRHGAAGFLNTDWGDHGHLQYLPVSFAGFAAGAAVSWCLQSNPLGPQLAAALDLYAFADEARVSGSVAMQLGNVYQAVGKLSTNRSALFSILAPSSTHSDPMQGITMDGLCAAEAAIDASMAPLGAARMRRADAQLIQDEMTNAAEMLRYACRRGRAALDPSAGQQRALGDQLQRIIDAHRSCWLARNRSGGLDDSIHRLV